jgi:TolA-binding protein
MREARFRVPLATTLLLAAAIPAFGQPPVPKPMPLPELPKLETPAVLKLPGAPADSADSAPVPARNERALFEVARSYFEESAYGSAAYNLREFLALYPRSRLAAEATYRLALADTFLDRDDDARKLREQLVRDYPKSPWARLVLTAHFTHEQLRKLADERRFRAKQNREDAVAAAEVYRILLQRHANDVSKAEVTYLMAVCLELYGSTDEARKHYKEVAEGENIGYWSTLARFRTGDAKTFRDGMADLIGLEAAGEEAHTFLDLADRFEPGLGDADRLHCEVLRGMCLARLNRDGEALAVWRKAFAEDPESPWAPECLFFLAEYYYRHKDVARAAEEYRRLLEKYPGSARAAVVRRWADALQNYDDDWADLERRLTAVGTKLTAGDLTFSAEFVCANSDDDAPVRARLAYQDRSHYVLEAALRDKEFLLLANDEGGWFRVPGENSVRTTPNGAPFPLPLMRLTFDPFTGKNSYTLASFDGVKGALLEISPEYVAATLSELQRSLHVRRLVRKVAGESRVIFQLEAASPDVSDPGTMELEFDAAEVLRTVRFSSVYAGKLRTLALVNIHIGESLPPGTFATHLPPGIEKREVASISMIDLLPEFTTIFQSFYKASENGNKD